VVCIGIQVGKEVEQEKYARTKRPIYFPLPVDAENWL
jgi:hypothetical protein